MQWFRNIKIKYKILLVAFVGVFGFSSYLVMNYQVTQANSDRLDAIRTIHFPLLERTDANLVRLDHIKDIWNSAVTTGDEDLVDDALVIAKKTREVFKEITSLDTKNSSDVSKLENKFKVYFSQSKKLTLGIIDETITGDNLKELAAELSISRKSYETSLHKFRDVHYKVFNEILKTADISSKNNLLWGLIIGTVVIVLLISSAILISSSINHGINKIIDAFKKMSKGDLTAHITHAANDEIGVLSEYYNNSVDKIRNLINEVIEGVIQLSSLSDVLQSAMNKTTTSVNQQHMETDQMATAIMEMTAAISEVASSANQTSSATQLVEVETKKGVQVVNDSATSIKALALDVEMAVTSIESLKEDSENIGAVLEVIKAIAEQTNLLALNAAIEAARAGEQGRGFAVVADEVRSLANRTQESTKEIQATIEKLQLAANNSADVMLKGRSQAKESVKHSVSAGDTLNNISKEVNSITEMSAHIAMASREQTTVAEEINKNIVSIKDLADETANHAQETAGNAREMSELSVSLANTIAYFKVR